ncbi:MAG: class I SAM-dependent methyltransferase [SAR202 cluster bacterium]|jgi:ubiquinone/menaquinone biosynthesis C-methylase UbiE|nr:class I SAM-dependent methyltransferase [SAR202 cluster bacterium]|tara:strand:- start:261 stop:944 length:684 start_codon:yes stop_codon:yes gene_type:complete
MPSNLAIELGGGDGQYLLGFAEKFEHVVFVDGSLANVVLAKALARDDGIANITFVRADITAVPISSSTFSMVHANGVIEHVNTPIALTTEIVRLTNTSGYSVVVSPNRNPITFEPHFRLPLFGLIPRLIRRPLIVIARGKGSEAGTDLLSLRRLRNTLLQTNAAWDVFVIPRGIDSTARQTRLRSIIARSMRSPVGAVADWLINRVFLPIAHSHIAIGQRRQYPPTP